MAEFQRGLIAFGEHYSPRIQMNDPLPEADVAPELSLALGQQGVMDPSGALGATSLSGLSGL